MITEALLQIERRGNLTQIPLRCAELRELYSELIGKNLIYKHFVSSTFRLTEIGQAYLFNVGAKRFPPKEIIVEEPELKLAA